MTVKVDCRLSFKTITNCIIFSCTDIEAVSVGYIAEQSNSRAVCRILSGITSIIKRRRNRVAENIVSGTLKVIEISIVVSVAVSVYRDFVVALRSVTVEVSLRELMSANTFGSIPFIVGSAEALVFSEALEVEDERRRLYYSGGVKLLYKKSFPSIEFVFSFRCYFRCRSSYSVKIFRRVIVGATSP